MPRIRPALLLCTLLPALAGCDNVARAFNPDPYTGGGTPTTTTSNIQIPMAAGDAVSGRPRVKAVFPTGSAWPGTVPILVEFNESINETSVLPTSNSANDAKVIVRVKGTTQAIPASYDFIAQDRLLVIRPTTGLSNQQTPTYEIVMLDGGRDIDGTKFNVAASGDVLGEFQVNQDTSITNGRILTTYPRDNQTGVRETYYYAFFDRPVNISTVTSSSCFLRPSGGTAIASAIDLPLSLLGQGDPRILRIVPDTTLDASTTYQLVVDATITFGTAGHLDFKNRTPFASFHTVGPRSPTAVHVGNPTVGFDDKINRNNLTDCVLHVTTPADARVGDRVVARIYGGDRSTTPTGDDIFVERSATVATAGAGTVVVDFSGSLGTLARPKFDDGSVTFAVQMQRGSEHSGFALNRSADAPRCDATAPTITKVGPPGSTTGHDIYTDQESLAFFGTASERIGSATLTDGVNPAVELFAASTDGRFVCKPLTLGRLTAPRGYSLLVTDLAGNLAVAPTTGNIVQRGVITGAFSGSLVVEAYDHTTLLPIVGATVLVDTGAPTVPATAQVVGTTGADGRATFASLGGTEHTVTIVRSGFHLATFYGTTAAFVSLPLRPTANATATLAGTANFQQAAGATVLVGDNTFDDPMVLGVQSASNAATTIPSTAIQPNRPQVITAFAGVFEPTTGTGYTSHGFQMLGTSATSPTPPAAPAAAAATSTQSVTLAPTSVLPASTMSTSTEDFALATGLDTTNLVGGKPIVRAMLSLNGFGGQVLAGVGHATATTGDAFSMSATYGAPLLTGLAAFSPYLWVATEARDSVGRVSRHRGLVLFGLFVDPVNPPAIPTITAPGGPSTGSPAVTFADALDPSGVPSGLAVAEVTARDSSGRQWIVYVPDTDAAVGTKTIQFPDLQTASVAGLATGTWSLRAEARVVYQVTGSTSADFLLAERVRQEVTYARSAATSFTIQ